METFLLFLSIAVGAFIIHLWRNWMLDRRIGKRMANAMRTGNKLAFDAAFADAVGRYLKNGNRLPFMVLEKELPELADEVGQIKRGLVTQTPTGPRRDVQHKK